MRCNGNWTEARYRSFIVSALRRASSRWAPKYLCKKQARIGRNQYRCAKCGTTCGNKDIKADHIAPVVDPIRGFVSWDEYISRLYVEVEGYQAICKTCHAVKTAEEMALRKKKI